MDLSIHDFENPYIYIFYISSLLLSYSLTSGPATGSSSIYHISMPMIMMHSSRAKEYHKLRLSSNFEAIRSSFACPSVVQKNVAGMASLTAATFSGGAGPDGVRELAISQCGRVFGTHH